MPRRRGNAGRMRCAGARSAARFLLSVAASVFAVGGVSAADHAAHAPTGKSPETMQKMWRTSLARQPLAATGYFDAHGTFWLAAVKDGHVTLARSDDQGRAYAAAVRGAWAAGSGPLSARPNS